MFGMRWATDGVSRRGLDALTSVGVEPARQSSGPVPRGAEWIAHLAEHRQRVGGP